ncbi:hypothetical protein [Bacillus velezensis]|uniref:hypothetical protein n=1 Tax=Bacillus velezensis TaxID=492670 RepID=UPI003D7F5B50
MKTKIVSLLLVLSLVCGFALPSYAKKSMNEKVKTNVSGMNVISQSEGEASYTIEYGGKQYFIDQKTLDKGTSKESIKVDQYLLTDGHRTLVDSATVNISDESSEMSTLAKCRGKQGVSVAIPIVKVSMNSCVIKKFLDIVEDADGIAGAIAGIAALIKKIPGISVYAGAIAGAMFAGKYAIKKVSDNGKYGISYNWIIGTPVVVPWRNG